MKKLILALSVCTLNAFSTLAAPSVWLVEKPEGFLYRDDLALHCENARAVINAGGKLELGKWYYDFEACKDYCDANDIPLYALWGNHGCVHCWYVEKCFVEQAFIDFQKNENAGRIIYCYMANEEPNYPDQKGSDAHGWMKCSYLPRSQWLSDWPFGAFYWKSHNINVHLQGDDNRRDEKGNKPPDTNAGTPQSTENIINKIRLYFKDWVPTPPYAGGYFTETNYPYASPQAESTTTYVDVKMVRESNAATNQVLKIIGKTTRTEKVTWAANAHEQTYRVTNFTSLFAEGKEVTLQLMDKDEKGADVVMSELKIACVALANSTENPKWIGKSFAKGEWTMDLAKAKEKVKNGTDGYKYTLVCVQGSLWCPDCGKVGKDFLGATKDGRNRFSEWAKEKGVALVTVDIPNFSSESIDAASPCLLKKEAYLTNPEGAEKSAMHSGLGYLTRNMISDADAAKALATNHFLVSKMTYEGGFNRPEERDYKKRIYRCGAPVFVLMNKDGIVRSELVRLAEDSDKAGDFDNIIRRFNEMLAICEDNATEIENNYASKANSIVFAANGGSEAARLCNADMYDTFRLDGVKGNARQVVVVKGDGRTGKGFDDDAKLTVEFQQIDPETGVAVTLGTAVSGTLKAGITNEYTFTKSGDYYVQVRGWGPELAKRADGYNSSAFSLYSTKNLHFQNYTITGTTIAIPQEDKASIKPPAGTDKVWIRLTANDKAGNPIVYRVKGMSAGGCAGLVPVLGAPVGFYTATADGDYEVTLESVDGELEYQVWKPGSLRFVPTEMTIPESYCDSPVPTGLGGEPLELPIQRSGGSSGSVTVTVTVDRVATTLDAAHFWLVDTNKLGAVVLTWADGDVEAKRVRIYVDDTLMRDVYDGNQIVVLRAVSDGGEAGDVRFDTGTDVFTLTVTEEDQQNPGKVFFSRTEPDFSRPGILYVRESEGARIYATRTDGSDGLVAAILSSSVKGTEFVPDDPRDIEAIGKEFPEMLELAPMLKESKFIYWSNRETGENGFTVRKIPAGKTAKVKMMPVGTLKGIAASNTVTVVSVADDAPGFETTVVERTLNRYISGIVAARVTDSEGGTFKGEKATFSKIAGTLPAGLKASVAVEAGGETYLEIAGVPTAKSGTYTPVYQISEKRAGKTVKGMVVKFVLTVVDPTSANTPSAQRNNACCVSRTFRNIALYDEKTQRLAGTVQLTIPPSGKMSAKFTGVRGTVSLSAACWNSFNDDSRALQSTLVTRKGDWKLEVEAESDSPVRLTLNGPDGEEYAGGCDGKVWSKKMSGTVGNPATDWQGYYTAALRLLSVASESTNGVPAKGIAPIGDGYVAFKMTTASAINSGTFTVAGVLPDSTKFSGSFVLNLENGVGVLPVFKASSKNVISTPLAIKAKAWQDPDMRRCVNPAAAADGAVRDGFWIHTERACAWETAFRGYGSYFDKDEDLGGCCAEYYQSKTLEFYVGTDYVGGTAGSPKIIVGEHTLTVDSNSANPNELKVSFSKTTGVVTGTFKLNGSRVSYSGIVVNGWGDKCGCHDEDVYLPLVSGSCWWKEGKPTRTNGDAVSVDN